jgi:hypothetical protein
MKAKIYQDKIELSSIKLRRSYNEYLYSAVLPECSLWGVSNKISYTRRLHDWST